jgi:hypothetical protein
MFGIVLAQKHRMLDLYLALGFQVIALILFSELERLQVAAPIVALSLGAYAAASLSTIYVLVVAEFKPVKMETATFATWLVCNAAFATALLVPNAVEDPTPNKDREPEYSMEPIRSQSATVMRKILS